MNKKVRIWIWWNCGMTKITLPANKAVRLSRQAPTEEGYEYEAHEYFFDGSTILRDVAEGGRDCDGRIDHYSSCVGDPKITRVDDNGNRRVIWRKINSSRRDHAAEAMGY